MFLRVGPENRRRPIPFERHQGGRNTRYAPRLRACRPRLTSVLLSVSLLICPVETKVSSPRLAVLDPKARPPALPLASATCRVAHRCWLDRRNAIAHQPSPQYHKSE